MSGGTEIGAAERAAVFRVVERLAALKHALGQRLSAACLGGPTLEASVALSAMAQDELGHGRVLLGLARGLDEVAAGDVEQAAEAQAALPAPLAGASGPWFDTLAACLTVDAAARLLLEGAAACTFAPLRARAQKMLEEEAFHRLYAAGWAEALRQSSGAANALARRLQDWLPAAAAWLDGLQEWSAPLAGVGWCLVDGVALRAAVQASAPGLVTDAA